MTYLLITYDKVTGQLIAIVDDTIELKVGYSPSENKIRVLRKLDILTTIEVEPNYPARSFIDFCFHVHKTFNP